MDRPVVSPLRVGLSGSASGIAAVPPLRTHASHNAFTAIPPALLLIPKLEVISLANNAIASIDLTSPIKPSEEGLSYGTGFLISAFERRDRAPKTVLPVLRTLNLAHNNLTNESLTGLAGKEQLKLRVITLSNNKLSGVLDINASGLGPQRLPELASLVLDANSDLHDIEGDLAQGCAVKMEDCGYTRTGGGIGGTPPPGSPAKKPANGAPAAYEPAPGGPSDIPNPSVTVAFVTHPAASFDSEPLALEMDVYVPDSASETKHPVVIWWHGGGLLQGNKENLPPHLRRLPKRPLGPKGEHAIVISPNYRLAPQAPILDIMADVDAAVNFARTKLDAKLAAKGLNARVDPDRIVLSGGSAGGYIALMAGLPVPPRVSDADIGGYRGSTGLGFTPRGIAPFYPITDLEHVFWATETNPVPWWPDGSVPDAAAQPHLNTRDPPVGFAVSGGPRSILYPYMLQHGLFPNLLFRNQRSVGHGLDGFRPNANTMSVTTRARMLSDRGVERPPIFLAYGTIDDKVQPLEESVEILKATKGSFELEVIEGADHAYDENPAEQCEKFAAWLEGVI
jgi:acetyl esterase/lipase